MKPCQIIGWLWGRVRINRRDEFSWKIGQSPCLDKHKHNYKSFQHINSWQFRIISDIGRIYAAIIHTNSECNSNLIPHRAVGKRFASHCPVMPETAESSSFLFFLLKNCSSQWTAIVFQNRPPFSSWNWQRFCRLALHLRIFLVYRSDV